MFHANDCLLDDLDDEEGRLLTKINDCSRWTSEKHALVNQLLSLLKKKKYIAFRGHVDRYHISRVGDSVLYYVPPGRRGHLSRFSGSYIRLICTGSGRYDREYMANEVTSEHVFKNAFLYRQIYDFKEKVCIDGRTFAQSPDFYLFGFYGEPRISSLPEKAVFAPDEKISFGKEEYSCSSWIYRFEFEKPYEGKKVEVNFIGLGAEKNSRNLCVLLHLRKPLILNDKDKVMIPGFGVSYCSWDNKTKKYFVHEKYGNPW